MEMKTVGNQEEYSRTRAFESSLTVSTLLFLLCERMASNWEDAAGRDSAPMSRDLSITMNTVPVEPNGSCWLWAYVPSFLNPTSCLLPPPQIL